MHKEAELQKQAVRGFIRALLRSRTLLKKAPKGLRLAKADKVPALFARGISDKASRRAWKGYKHLAGHGVDSVVAFLPSVAAEKIFGEKKVRDAIWKYVNGPALTADTAAGSLLRKTPLVGKKLFTTTEKVPWGKKLHKEVERASALAPLTKMRAIGEPILVGVGLEKGIRKIKEIASTASSSKDQARMDDKELREKAASTMLHLHEQNRGHEKRAQALRVLYKQAQMGLVLLPQTYEELNEKLASLCTEDLVVFEKALELAGGQMKLGELSQLDSSAPLTTTQKFQAAILGDEL